MLYISRYANFAGYGVVDTDDNREEVVMAEDIRTACIALGLDIAGVHVRDLGRIDLSKPIGKKVGDVLAYQPPATMSVLQSKMQVMYGLDIIVYGNIISNIRWNSLGHKVSVRLSDFGTVVGDRFLYGNWVPCDHEITLVFDDKLDIYPQSFGNNGYAGHHPLLGDVGLALNLDIRELSDKNAEYVYRRLLPLRMEGQELKKLTRDIIDDERRKAQILRSLW